VGSPRRMVCWDGVSRSITTCQIANALAASNLQKPLSCILQRAPGQAINHLFDRASVNSLLLQSVSLPQIGPTFPVERIGLFQKIPKKSKKPVHFFAQISTLMLGRKPSHSCKSHAGRTPDFARSSVASSGSE
jgi:hypothetical protein